MERQMCRVLARSEIVIETLEGHMAKQEKKIAEQEERIEELQREKARLEIELHEARHAEQEQQEADDAGELGIDAKAEKARQRALKERQGQADAAMARIRAEG